MESSLGARGQQFESGRLDHLISRLFSVPGSKRLWSPVNVFPRTALTWGLHGGTLALHRELLLSCEIFAQKSIDVPKPLPLLEGTTP
jgi:hypothetical protein